MESVGEPNRLEWVDWLRGLAILFVVFHHAVVAFVVVGVSPPDWALVTNSVVSPYRMPMLMFLSGLLLDRSLRKPTRVYIAGKLRRIGWPYLVWTMGIIVFLVAASQLLGSGGYSIESILSLILDPRTYTWYLAYLLLYYLLALVVPPLARAVAVPVLFTLSFVIHDGDGWTRLTFLLAFFFLGDLAARIRESGGDSPRRPCGWALHARSSGSQCGCPSSSPRRVTGCRPFSAC